MPNDFHHAAPNNSFNPTALSLPFINVVSCDVACVLMSGGGLIRALCVFFYGVTNMKPGSCRLCLIDKDLAHSHIFPEFFYEPTYDETNRFVSLSTHPRQKPKLFEKGLREYLLCEECEAQFSRYESYAASILRKAGDYRTPDNHFIVIPDFDYARFKLFGLSLI
jgi:hypothetical protein